MNGQYCCWLSELCGHNFFYFCSSNFNELSSPCLSLFLFVTRRCNMKSYFFCCCCRVPRKLLFFHFQSQNAVNSPFCFLCLFGCLYTVYSYKYYLQLKQKNLFNNAPIGLPRSLDVLSICTCK